MSNGFNQLARRCNDASASAGWWNGEHTPETFATKLCLIHSEVSEAMEALRKDKMDDKLPHRHGVEVELADAIIRIADLAGQLNLDVEGAIEEKMKYNSTRLDHKLEVRNSEGGKRF